RLMSAATAVLAVALLLAGQPGGVSPVVALLVQVTALASGCIFGLGFSPPRALRLSWRRAEVQHLQHATMAVLRADTVDQVARELLPPTARIVGGAGAALVDINGLVVTAHGQVPEVGTDLAPAGAAGPAREVLPLGEGRGELVVWTSPYSPFFGREEIDLLRTMGAIASLALERCELLEDERAQRKALEQARREAERARDEASRANTAKSEFLSRMSHELRTPLNAILGFGQLLETSTLDADDQEGVKHILKAGRHLLALINDVLDLSRIEAGTLTISLEPVHAGELIDDAVGLIQPLADSRSIRLTIGADRCGTFVRTDRQRCRQILLNLLSNAVKYNHDGGEVEVRCARVAEETLRVSVRDSGPGIDPARRERLFEPFERLGAESSNVEGTGLGLALTKQLVERLGGAIGVDTAPGQGTTFWIDLPVTQRPADSSEPATRPQKPAERADRTLLLVEDNLANLRVVEAMLRRRPGIAVLPAMQGRLAIELAHEHQPDVIVLDLHLPDLPGREVLHRLLADPRTRGIPVVIASADATPGRVRQLREEGAFEYLAKPLDLWHFLEVVDAALTRRDAGREHGANSRHLDATG
ncbi:MAG: ATP-binding protein, partial [Actinomycetota bacterium]|nr:ATP-binding protein [Actinomycetota bacterium]